MSFIALFLPACISLAIRHKRNKKAEWSMPQSLVEYGILVLVNVFLAEAVIVYVLGVTEVSVEAFSSFSFFIKYVVISSVIALIIPYMEEFVRKYISISYEVKIRDDKE